MDFKQWTSTLVEPLTELTKDLITLLPNLLKAIILLFIGWLVAHLLHMLTVRLVSPLSRFLQRGIVDSEQKIPRMEWWVSGVIARIIYWMVFFLFLSAATEALNLQVVTNGLSYIVNFLPAVLAAVLIFLSGLVLSNIARAAILATAASSKIRYGELLGQGVKFIVLLLVCIIALEQIGIDSTLLIIITALVVGTLLGGLALAFGLGAPTAVSNIIASHYLTQTYKIGQQVKVGDVQGTIIEIKTNSVILDSPEGQVLVPAKEFSDKVSILLDKGRGK